MSSAELMVSWRSCGQHAMCCSTGCEMWLHPNTRSVWSERSISPCSVLRTTQAARSERGGSAELSDRLRRIHTALSCMRHNVEVLVTGECNCPRLPVPAADDLIVPMIASVLLSQEAGMIRSRQLKLPMLPRNLSELHYSNAAMHLPGLAQMCLPKMTPKGCAKRLGAK